MLYSRLCNTLMVYFCRARDIGKFKADMAATSINNELDQINQRNCDLSSMRRKWKVVPIVGKVGRGDSDESPIFTDSFWEGLDVVVSAVDTVEARLAIDEHCCRHGIPLVDAGTQGLLGSTQVILPGCTERYADSADPEMGQTPVCTIKSFPYAVNHCVAWALQKLQTLCVEEVGIMSNLLTVRDCNVAERALAVLGVEDLRSFGDWVDAMRTLRVLDKMDAATNSSDSLRSVVPDLIDKLGKGKEQLMVAVFVEYAFKLFFRLFERETATLIQQHPANSVDESGVAFWSGSRQQMPRVESWPLFASHYKLSCLQEFVIHTTILKARVSGIQLDEITVLDMIDQFEALNAIRLIREIVLANDADPMDFLSLQNKIVNGARTLINSDNASNPFDFRPFVFEKVGGTTLNFNCSYESHGLTCRMCRMVKWIS